LSWPPVLGAKNSRRSKKIPVFPEKGKKEDDDSMKETSEGSAKGQACRSDADI